MAPVPIEDDISYILPAVVVTHVLASAYLSYAVGASLYTSYRSISVSQDTRKRSSRRKKLALIFSGLAVAAFSVAAYSTVSYAALSYKVWADERGEQLPRFLDATESSDSGQIHLVRWLSDTRLYSDALEIVAEKARRYWWGQQLDLATSSFSMLLAIEGRRRRIPLLTAFMALAHLVNLSYAQNLFYLALLLTPQPIPAEHDQLELQVAPVPASLWARVRGALSSPKPTNWCPHPLLHVATLFVNLGATALLPYVAGSPWFAQVSLVARASTFLPLIVPKFVPVSWGGVQSRPSATTVFRTLSVAGFASHLKASFFGLTYSLPDSYYHRHSKFLPWDAEERSTWERSTTAVGKVLGSTGDHPIVAAVGYDVLVCTLSLGLWAAVRSTDLDRTFMSMLPFYKPSFQSSSPSITDKKSSNKAAVKSESEDTEALEPAPRALRRSGRPKSRATSSTAGSFASSSELGDDVATPTPATAPRRRGRPKKQQPPEPEPEEDQAYVPTPQEARSVVEGDVVPVDDLDWESAAMTWGLAALGGLGTACAGIFGGECLSSAG